MTDGAPRTVDEIQAAAGADPAFAAKPPKRNTLATRLHERAKLGRFDKLPGGP
jgi:hypothetical protein